MKQINISAKPKQTRQVWYASISEEHPGRITHIWTHTSPLFMLDIKRQMQRRSLGNEWVWRNVNPF